jgi:hypothetical protein
MAAGDLYDAASELLDACVLILDAEAPLGAPATTFVSPGEPADDCDMLTVRVQNLGEEGTSPAGIGDAGHRHRWQRINQATFVIRVIRCVPTSRGDGTPETPAEMAAAAGNLYADGWSLWNGLMQLRRDSGLLNGYCSAVYFESAVVVPLLGFVGGWEITLRADLNGYRTTLGT